MCRRHGCGKRKSMVCLPKTAADFWLRKKSHFPLCRYTAQQGLNIRNNDDDDDDEKEDYDDDHHQGMGCHCSALRLQQQVIKVISFTPLSYLPGSTFIALRKMGKLSQKLDFFRMRIFLDWLFGGNCISFFVDCIDFYWTHLHLGSDHWVETRRFYLVKTVNVVNVVSLVEDPSLNF